MLTAVVRFFAYYVFFLLFCKLINLRVIKHVYVTSLILLSQRLSLNFTLLLHAFNQ